MAARVLIVGAGFAGAVYARELADAGYEVEVLDRRTHVAGNAYDEVLPSGLRVHRYGPHLFHTNNARVVEWLRRFACFRPYEHRVRARLPDGRLVPLPINRRTVNAVFDTKLTTGEEVRAFLAAQSVPNPRPANAAEHLAANIGTVLADLFFRPYTRKMWDLDLEELDAAVVKRIPLRYDDEDRYFPDDKYQMLPRNGYTQLVGAILDHRLIRVSLNQPFEKTFAKGCVHCFNSMPIDEYFDFALGPLPYRSIRFHHVRMPAGAGKGEAATTNYTDRSVFTRHTDWSLLPGHGTPAAGTREITREEPCDYRDNDMERFYPVKTSDGRHQATYARYKELGAASPHMSFIGRCGTYQYLDMHQVINQSLSGARAWLDAQR